MKGPATSSHSRLYSAYPLVSIPQWCSTSFLSICDGMSESSPPQPATRKAALICFGYCAPVSVSSACGASASDPPSPALAVAPASDEAASGGWVDAVTLGDCGWVSGGCERQPR